MPRGEEIPVTPALITWARQRAGFSLAEAVEKFSRIEAWETGSSFPTYPQLERLAEAFRLPVAVFFFPEPPDVPPIEQSFRTLPDAEFDQMPRRIRYLLRKAKAFQLGLAELNNGRNPASRLITRDLVFTSRTSVADMAGRVREYIGIPLEQQFAWTNDDQAVKAWRKSLFDVGIFTFKDSFREDTYSGFSLYDETFPLIYVNNSFPKTRQAFTLFHELAHLLFHTSGIDTRENDYVDNLPDRQKQIEILCNRFAAEFLVPEAAFRSALAALRDRASPQRAAEQLAARFNVSREFIYRKFLDRGLIGQAEYEAAAKRWAAQKQPSDGGDPYWSKLAYLGREYVALAFNQYYQNRITDTQLADYLDVKPKNIGTLEEYFLKGAQ
jgi:Zn-dependent peptidase ImmA (M78 family)